MACEPSTNSFRAEILSGRRASPLVEDKCGRRGGADESLDQLAIPRQEHRRGNHRDDDRHRLTAETAVAVHGGESHAVELINLSGGGAMIRGGFKPRLWDPVELNFNDGPGLEGVVRWLRDDRIGIEFAHETRLDCDGDVRDRLLLEVIQRSFPDSEICLDRPSISEVPEPTEADDRHRRVNSRHPLIWAGRIHYAHDSHAARLRNISSGGSLVEVAMTFPVGAQVVLDLGESGQIESTVAWTYGDQTGLRFAEPFDLALLARGKPEVAPTHWQRPAFLDCAPSSPWDEQWGRRSISEIRADLEGYLKR